MKAKNKKTKTKESKFLDLKNIDRTTEAAVYYGFLPIEIPKIEKEDRDRIKALKDGEPIIKIGANEKISNRPEEKAAILRNYFNTNLAIMPQPIMITYNGFIDEGGEKGQGKQRKIGLEIIGSNNSISEAIIIKTAMAILADNGLDNLYVEINSLGDRESCARFIRELTAYFRKNINAMPASCRQAFKKDPLLALTCQNEKCNLIKDEAPKPVGCLSDESRAYFKEILEYLEGLNIPYKINDYLLSDRRYASGSVFEIKQRNENPKLPDISLAIGFRYDGICKKLGFKKDVPAIGMKICFKSESEKRLLPKIKRASVFFIQLGDEAKHKSLKVIDILRQEDIYVHHSLGRDKMAGQLALADRTKTPYILIMGKKEAMENTIMIRDVATRSQETILIVDLPIHLKKLFK
ncbi:MAG: His/Gly/Thr/Pro-type tRNA ligase C-terminal domain-containing protein [Candidatus Paceibacterota bacterium]